MGDCPSYSLVKFSAVVPQRYKQIIIIIKHSSIFSFFITKLLFSNLSLFQVISSRHYLKIILLLMQGVLAIVCPSKPWRGKSSP